MADDDDQIINPFSTTPIENPYDKKLKILAAAEEIISNKGFKEATISEIASQVGIKDSILYRYFKGKEDILFSIAEERLKEGLALLDRDLQGLNDPKSSLRKMMWGNLWYHNHYHNYSRILLFECFSSNKFFSSPANLLLQKYMSRLTAILEQGVRENQFRRDIPVALMQDMVFGLMNMIVIGFHELGEAENPVLDFEEAASLVDFIISPPQPESERPNVDKTSLILNAAERVFAKKGFDRAKMTEIARVAGVADGTIYEYFENKNNLLFSIPKRRFQNYVNDLSADFYPESVAGRLKKLIKYHFSTLLADQDFLRVFVYNLFFIKGFYHSEAFEIFRTYYKLFEAVIEEGKTAQVFRPEINSRLFRDLLMGTFCLMAVRWLPDAKMTEVDMMKVVNHLTDLLVEAVAAESPKEESETPA